MRSKAAKEDRATKGRSQKTKEVDRGTPTRRDIRYRVKEQKLLR